MTLKRRTALHRDVKLSCIFPCPRTLMVVHLAAFIWSTAFLVHLQSVRVCTKSFRRTLLPHGRTVFYKSLGWLFSFCTFGTIPLLHFCFVCCVPLRQCRSRSYCLLDWNAHAHEHDAYVGSWTSMLDSGCTMGTSVAVERCTGRSFARCLFLLVEDIFRLCSRSIPAPGSR